MAAMIEKQAQAEQWDRKEAGGGALMTEAQRRKQRPIYSGVVAYFPDALEEVAYVSYVGNQQHNPGQELHWAKEKSSDEPDALLRHLTDRARGSKYDTDGLRHLAKAAWRALANLQREIDAEKKLRYAAQAEQNGGYPGSVMGTRGIITTGPVTR